MSTQSSRTAARLMVAPSVVLLFVWMAVPLASGTRIEGILYLDAREPGFFTESRQDLILRAAVGVARYVAERYA